MSIFKHLVKHVGRKHGIDLDDGPVTQMEKAEESRDEQVQKISFLVREYLETRKPGASRKSTNQAQIRVVAEWIRDEFLKEASGDCGQIKAWISRAEKLKGKDRDNLLEERIKGPISGQVKMLLIA